MIICVEESKKKKAILIKRKIFFLLFPFLFLFYLCEMMDAN